ncbi:MAG: nickel pincer cofactor biosynthesis protein LarC [Roseburia sp.]|nr:nickel pincer cofactor biosynthesis protein LarC [Roseburia sp.]MCM1098515.1 nickel pincer cofactor biosynthesis protein LarC [Ruminococcus flavefaciens]
MKILYLDCGMGAAGDMLTAALLELLPDPDQFLEELNGLGIPGVRFQKERSVKCGIVGTHVSVTVNGEEEEGHDADIVCDHSYSHGEEEEGHDADVVCDHSYSHGAQEESHDADVVCDHGHSHGAEAAPNHSHSHGEGEHSHHHSNLGDLEHIVREHLALPEKVREDVLAVYGLIAEAESVVHGVPVTEIHFHEVGTLDAVADVAAVCLLMNRLAPDRVVASPVHVGSGQVRCAHGVLPIPAPATALLLKGLPIYGGSVRGELCTPTGAALLKYFATDFGDMPVMTIQAVGYGMGKKDFPAANCVRALLGEGENREDTVLELSCNVDDMTAEAVGFAVEQLLQGGALDVYTVPIGMKKSRPGTLIRVMCREEKREALTGLLFRHTTTLGVRETKTRRYILERRIEELETPYGSVRRKDASGYGVSRSKYEYEDLARIAREQGMSIREAEERVKNSGGSVPFGIERPGR